jgi:hypothetical protein
MTEKMIKFRLFHFYVEEDALTPGQTTLVERQAFFGETVDIPREEDVRRGDKLDAFFSKEEIKQIKAGTYAGPDAGALVSEAIISPPLTEAEAAARSRTPAQAAAKGQLGTGEAPAFDVASASSEAILAYVSDNKLTVPQTIALAKDADGEFDPELAEKILDAEEMVPGGARGGVISKLEAVTAGGTGSGVSNDDEETPNATDEAMELANQNDVDLADITGSGAGGRILVSDVQSYIAEGENE